VRGSHSVGRWLPARSQSGLLKIHAPIDLESVLTLPRAGDFAKGVLRHRVETGISNLE
jgi:hypothetical protein